jgi:hypothetical protein
MKLNSIVTSSLLSAVVAALAISPNTANATADYKTYHASGGCKVYGATPWTSLGFGWQGVRNLTDSSQYIICPVVTDSESGWTAASSNARMHVHASSGNVAGTVTCVVYSMAGDFLVSSTTISMPMPANTPNNFGTDSGWLTNYSGQDGGVMMLCQLAPKTGLIHYTIQEFSATDVP